MKSSNQKLEGLLMPLPIPNEVWFDISMDFIVDLPKVEAKSVILVVVDRLSEFAHFYPLPQNFNAAKVVEVFTSQILRLQGIPKTIVFDRDKNFTSKFWRELHKLSGSTLHFSLAYHPQSDSQTKVVNRTLELYLRAYCHEDPRKWLKLFSWAELRYNSSYHSSLGRVSLYSRFSMARRHHPFHIITLMIPR